MITEDIDTHLITENNKRQPQGTIDLHGLYVAESVTFTEQAINVRHRPLSVL